MTFVEIQKKTDRELLLLLLLLVVVLLYTVRKHENVVDNTYDYFRCGVKIGSIT